MMVTGKMKKELLQRPLQLPAAVTIFQSNELRVLKNSKVSPSSSTKKHKHVATFAVEKAVTISGFERLPYLILFILLCCFSKL
jgi:hypothetical protein